MLDIFNIPMPMGLLQATGNWPIVVLLVVGWAKIGAVVWGLWGLIKAGRGHGELGDKFQEAMVPGIVLVMVLAPDLITKVLGIGDNSAIMSLLSSWTLTP